MATREEVLALMEADEFEGLTTLRLMGSEIVPILVSILNGPSTPAYLRHRATVVLGEIGAQSAVADIKGSLANADPVQRLTAVRALAKISGSEAVTTLIPLLDDPDPSVAKVVVQCLATVGGTSALARLEQVKSATVHDFLRAEAVNAITEIKKRVG
jgi:HEAT repeat protein